MVKELAGRLAALDPDAGAAVQVIAYFDRLVDGRAGLEAIVRGAAVLAGCPARLIDDERRVRIRMTATGVRQDDSSAPDPQWLHRLGNKINEAGCKRLLFFIGGGSAG